MLPERRKEAKKWQGQRTDVSADLHESKRARSDSEAAAIVGVGSSTVLKFLELPLSLRAGLQTAGQSRKHAPRTQHRLYAMIRPSRRRI